MSKRCPTPRASVILLTMNRSWSALGKGCQLPKSPNRCIWHVQRFTSIWQWRASQNAPCDQHRLGQANSWLLPPCICGNAVRRDATMLNNYIGKSIIRGLLAIPARSDAGYTRKGCFLADRNCARFKRDGESQQSLAQEQDQKGSPCLFRLPRRQLLPSNWQCRWHAHVNFRICSSKILIIWRRKITRRWHSSNKKRRSNGPIE